MDIQKCSTITNMKSAKARDGFQGQNIVKIITEIFVYRHKYIFSIFKTFLISFSWFSLILCSNTFTFWIIKTLLIFAEPPLLSFQVPPNALVSKLMVIVLGVSTLLFVMQLFSDVIVRKNEIDKHWIEMINSLELPGNSSSSGKSRIAETKKKAGPVRRALNFYLHNTPYWLEGACLMCGIVFTGYGRPGIASLRMFRFFIVLWYVCLVLCQSVYGIFSLFYA